MIHKWMGEVFDTVLFLGLLFGLVCFFLIYWENAYQVRQAEWVLQEFLDKTSAEGRISSEEYAGLVTQLEQIDTGYELQVTCSVFNLQPVYAKIPEAELEQYYMSRNHRKKVVFKPYEMQLEEEKAETLQWQTETNATILAAEKEYLPLPENGSEPEIKAVRSIQEVYEGETLITLCRITSEKGVYFMAAEPVCPISSGQIFLELELDEEIYKVPVEVICHPRKVICANGHELVNSRKVLEQTKQTGEISCPYCGVLPDRIECNTIFISKRSGECLNGEEVWLEVTYKDGHTEILTPEAEEWQDDYDENFCGLQNVTIFYRGIKTVVTVLSENDGCLQCSTTCNGRYYTDYVAFPYCVRCMSQVLLFTGKVYEEEILLGQDELVAALDKSGEVCLKAGDYISILLKKNGKYKSVLQKMVKRDGRSR